MITCGNRKNHPSGRPEPHVDITAVRRCFGLAPIRTIADVVRASTSVDSVVTTGEKAA